MSWVNVRPPRIEAGSSADAIMTAFSEVVAGVLVYGLLGWVGDHFLHTRFLLPLGVLLGLGLSLYLIYKRHIARNEGECA
ncbi:MAG: hypothetical protein FWC46_04935 [Actinomycetia bacterium]|nr:hypothetical protein [Actinomycetes bacterium]